MTIKIAINGFGRMGRLVLRAAFSNTEANPEFEFVLINEKSGTAEVAAHLLEFDSVHGRWDQQITHDDQSLSINGHKIPVSHEDKIENLDLTSVDILLECSGAYRRMDQLQDFSIGARKK